MRSTWYKWGIRGLGAGWESMCQGVTHRESPGTQLPCLWSLWENECYLRTGCSPILPAGSSVPGLAEALPSLQPVAVGCPTVCMCHKTLLLMPTSGMRPGGSSASSMSSVPDDERSCTAPCLLVTCWGQLGWVTKILINCCLVQSCCCLHACLSFHFIQMAKEPWQRYKYLDRGTSSGTLVENPSAIGKNVTLILSFRKISHFYWGELGKKIKPRTTLNSKGKTKFCIISLVKREKQNSV